MNQLSELKKELRKRRMEIKKRLAEFKSNWKNGNKKIFSQLVFCLCTPQSNAVKCSKAVELIEKKKLLKAKKSEIKKCLQGRVRFHNTKAENIFKARKVFSRNHKLEIKKILKEQGIEENHLQSREWLVENVKGLGFKEASHFLRNIGFYENTAILDRHVLKNLKSLGVIKRKPKNLDKKKYYLIEKKLIEFCKKNRIKMEELDLALWAKETGFVFK